MSESFTVADTDVTGSSIVQGTLDLTTPVAPAADSYVVQVGDNLWTGTENKFIIDRALQYIIDALREARWPVGAAASNFAHIAVVTRAAGVIKSDVVIGNAATHPALTEDAVLVEYNVPISGAGATSGGTSQTGGGGAGSSLNKGPGAIARIRDFIRERLHTTAA